MIEEYARPSYQKLLVNPMANFIAKYWHWSANLVTLFSFIFGSLAAVAIYYQVSWLAIGMILLSGYCDTLDGTLARLQHQSTDIGSMLDILCDRYVEFILIMALFLVEPASRGIPSMLMLGSVLLCITSFLVVGIFSENNSHRSFYYSPGLMERAEAFIFFIAMILIPAWFAPLAYLFSFLVVLTALIRVIQFAKQQA